jgi:hypothetical protein
MIYLRTKFHMPRTDASMVIAFKPNSREHFRADVMLLFYILHEVPKITFGRFSKVYYHTSFQDPKLHYRSYLRSSWVRNAIINNCTELKIMR